MKLEQTITIIPSVTLEECRLPDLAGRQGKVCEINYAKDGSVKGCWVELEGEPYLDEQEWYIPMNSIVE